MSEMTKYELTLVVRESKDTNLEGLVAKYRELLIQGGGSINTEHDWKVRRMAYSMKGERFGHYYTFLFSAAGSRIEELKREMNLDNDILRYLIISLDKEGIGFDDVKNFPSEQELTAPVEAPVALGEVAPEEMATEIDTTEEGPMDESIEKEEEKIEEFLETAETDPEAAVAEAEVEMAVESEDDQASKEAMAEAENAEQSTNE